MLKPTYITVAVILSMLLVSTSADGDTNNGTCEDWCSESTCAYSNECGGCSSCASYSVPAPDQTAIDELNQQLSTYGGRVHATNKTDWLSECVEFFKRGGFYMGDLHVKYSTYHLKDKPSGLCNIKLFVDINKWTNEIASVFSETDLMNTKFEDIESKLPSIALPDYMSFPETAKDVSDIVQFANANSMKISIKNSGHSYTGGSSSKGALQINLRRFPKYSFTHVYECKEEGNYTPLGHHGPCKLALARGKTAVVRVGGGQGNDDMYRSVMDYNYNEPRSKRYNVVGGAEGMIGGGGGWMMGGGLGRGEERLYGSGADQVLELEMILPNGYHVKFGPTEWEKKEGYEYPKTIKVEGLCNRNIHHDEAKWDWVTCDEGKDRPYANVTFADLWFAVRGGGGGSWGVLLASHINLHELLPQYFIEGYSPDPSKDTLLQTCAKLENNPGCPQWVDMMNKMWIDFVIDLLWNEKNEIGVDKDLSRHCGHTGNPFENPIINKSSALKCHGYGIQEKFSKAWHASVDKSPYILPGYGNKELCEIKNRIVLQGGAYDQWHRIMLNSNTNGYYFPHSPVGHYQDGSGPEGVYEWSLTIPIMIPPSLMAAKNKLSWYLASNFMVGHTLPYAEQNDQMTPFAEVYHSGGIQTYIWPPTMLNLPANPCTLSEDVISSIEEETAYIMAEILSYIGYKDGDDFPGFVEYNHFFITSGGQLKSDPTKPCPFMLSRQQKKELCLSAQETVWGSKHFHRLKAIKEALDPDNIFDVHMGVGNDERPGPMTDYCAYNVEPTIPPLTRYDISEIHVPAILVEQCKATTTESPSSFPRTFPTPTSKSKKSKKVKVSPNPKKFYHYD